MRELNHKGRILYRHKHNQPSARDLKKLYRYIDAP